MSFWDWVPSLIETGVSLWGASKQADANKQATEVAIAQQDKATQAQLQALQLAEQNQKAMQLAASPGLVQTQKVIARGEELTPAQIQAMEDARRQSLNALQGSSLRGSARATAATVNDVENRMRTSFLDQNRSRADNAAQTLTGQYFNAGSGVTNIATGRGNAVSSGLISSGQNMVDSIKNDAAIKTSSIGDIGAVIADHLKASNTEKRTSSYGDPITWFKRDTA